MDAYDPLAKRYIVRSVFNPRSLTVTCRLEVLEPEVSV